MTSDLPAPVVLLVGLAPELEDRLARAVAARGYGVASVPDCESARRALERRAVVAVLTALQLPDGRALDLLHALTAQPDFPPLVAAGSAVAVSEAVTLIKEGAEDVVVTDGDPDVVAETIAAGVDERRRVRFLASRALAGRRGFPPVIGDDASLQCALSALARVARSDTTVLLEGESGTGKELFARGLHALSDRATGPFVAINCAAIPETLLETELFGHERGAFTGASARKLGKFEVAHTGTLFLDEIAELPLGLQGKILRVLEERRFERVGGNDVIQVDTRIVAASNRNLREEVARKAFREDLYFRLSVFPIAIPPLRARGDDVVLLAEHFALAKSREQGKAPVRFSTAALDAIRRYPWPGNVRELQNCIERAVILTDDSTIHATQLHLPSVGSRPRPSQPAEVEPHGGVDLSGRLADVSRRGAAAAERQAILQALQRHRGHEAAVCEDLGVTSRTLRFKMRTLGIP